MMTLDKMYILQHIKQQSSDFKDQMGIDHAVVEAMEVKVSLMIT